MNSKPSCRRRPRISWKLPCILLIAWAASTTARLPVVAAFVDSPVTADTESGNSAAAPGPSGQQSPSTADEQTDDHASSHGGHKDPVADVLLAIAIILLLAKVAGDVFERLQLPAVLGELTVGILLGNWALFTGSHAFDFFKPALDGHDNLTGTVLDMLARIGVVLLLFEVGLESRVREMVSVGLSSLLVALLGVVAPMVLGFGVGYVLIGTSWQVPAFLGATLCATSVGITARVLKDLGRSQDRESRIILGAAVIDDVLGLIVLAVVSGVIEQGAEFEPMSLLKIVGLSFAFLAAALLLGKIQLPRLIFRAASFLRGQGLLVATALVICFFFSWAANKVELAPIIGAFAAGLILEGAHYRDIGDKWKNHRLEDALAPISALLVPIFFVATGIAVDLSQFSGGSVWVLAAGLTVTAIIGKQVCSFGVREPGLNRLAVGLGMIPRGEVGLIFAKEGQGLLKPDGQRVIDDATYSAIVVMVMVTTMITPPLLKWALSRGKPDAQDTDELRPTATT